MQRDWRTGVSELCFVFLALAGIGWFLDLGNWLLLGALLIYFVWSNYQLIRLHRWLDGLAGSEPPDSSGLWGAVFDRIFELQRKQKKSRKRLRKNLARFHQSMSALRDGVVMVDGDHCLQWWNGAASSLMGFKLPEDRGQKIANLLRDPTFNSYYRKGDYSEPLEIRSPAHIHKTLQIQITDYGKNDRLMLIRDTSLIQQLEQVRSEFVANVSHELKTPLTVIRGYLENLLESNAEFQPAVRQGMNQMQSQALRMQHLIDDLLYLSRLESTEHESDKGQVPLHALLEQIRADFQPLADKKQQTISVDASLDTALNGQESELYSAFSNLTSNALKYSGDGGHIEIFTETMPNGDLCVAFRDDGIGIDAECLPRLTERFYRVDKSRSIASGGTGLGLAITKHVLLRHGGSLEIESRFNQGSCFRCRFPAEAVSTQMLEDPAG